MQPLMSPMFHGLLTVVNKFNIIRKKAAAMQRLASSTVATCNRQMQCAVETVCSVPACGTMLPLHLEL